MSAALEGLAEIVDRLLYDVLALLVPGATGCVLFALLVGRLREAASSAEASPWLAVLACYVAGQVLQALSRWVVVTFLVPFRLGEAVCRWVGKRLLAWRPTGWLIELLRDYLVSVAQLQSFAERQPEGMETLQRRLWLDFIGPQAKALGPREIRDLSFSAIPNISRLYRFRVAASASRALAAVTILAASLLAVRPYFFSQFAWTAASWWWLAALVGVARALAARADHYHELQEASTSASFIAASTHPRLLEERAGSQRGSSETLSPQG